MSTEQNIVVRVLNWLRAGYPQGVPQQDYIALFGLLHRRLTETEVAAVARGLRDEGRSTATEDEVREAIEKFVLEEPDAADVNRVRAHLAAGGWPLADPTADDDQPAAPTAPVAG